MTRLQIAWCFQDIRRAQGYIKAIRADLRERDDFGNCRLSYADQLMASDEIAFQVAIIRRCRTALKSA